MKPPADVKIQNEMILASAGSGKTFQLTNRYIGLMALGEDPEKIIALTFTRKAAGEFFDSILQKLAGAADNEQYAAALAESPYIPHLTCDDYRRLLRLFIDRSHLVFLGTLDSFFVSIIHNFPFEFGLSGEFEILDDHLATLEKERVYRDVFTRTRHAKNKSGAASTAAFLEAFKLATFGREESSLLRELNRFVDEHHEVFLSAPHEEKWGNPKAVWPEDNPWLGNEIDLPAEFDCLFAILENEDLTNGQLARWEAFRDAAQSHTPGNPMADELSYLLMNLLKVWPDLETHSAAPTVERKKQPLSPEACDHTRRIVVKIVGAELASRLLRTRGIWTVLRQYESAYAQLVRRRGKLTFNDLQLILGGTESASPLLLSQQPAAAGGKSGSNVTFDEAKLNIDYRLDGRYDHWLLDEFQDTNQLQWRVVENLIDEVMQDAEGRRTLFQVGDIKQAIYAWRGGDTRLFYNVRDRYNTGKIKRIVERELNDSWRSGPDVIRLVNRVFGNLDTLRNLFPAPAVDRWDWRDHAAAQKDLAGFAALINPVPAQGGKLDPDHPLEVAAAILNEIQPVQNNLSCAVLFQTNKNINHAVELLRRKCPGIPFLNESETTVATNSAPNLALLSLLKIAAHPGDSFAWQHLQMTPFAGLIGEKNQLITQLTHQVFDDGFEATLQHWIDLLQQREGNAPSLPKLNLDTFNLRRADELLLAAQQFDQTGNRDISSFLTFAERYTLREPATRGVVNLMTIHKAKGLGFDVVILPGLGGNSLATTRDRIGVKKNADSREIEWIYDLPQKEIAKIDPVLAAHLEDEAAEACFENLCKFYVALTRAKRALYCIANPPAKSSKSHNFIKLLHDTLPENDADPKPTTFGDVACDLAFATGHQDWYQSLKKESVKSAKSVGKKPGPEVAATTHYRRRPLRRTPSGAESHEITSQKLFARGGQRARDHGTAVHALFEQIEWLDATANPADLVDQWAAAANLPNSARDAAVTEFLSSLESKEIRRTFALPSSSAECWNERRFEILLENDWFTGTFDRVVVDHTNNRAAILDFKTDNIIPGDRDQLEKAVDGYRPQLETYRRVLSRMTGLPASAIRLQLLFTRLKKIVELG